MIGYALRRILIAIPLLAVVSVVAFLLMQLTPGDPATLMLGQDANPESVARLREQLGLSRPLHEQYLTFLGGALRGDLGRSFVTHLPVAGELARAWPATFALASAAMAIALVVGLPLGVVTGVRPRSMLDHATRVVVLVGVSIPVFWSGLLLIYVFAVQLGWLPTSGAGSPRHLILPALSLSTFSLAAVVRLTRASMLEVMGEDYVRTARAKGLREPLIVIRHALKVALVPVVTIVGLQFGQLLAGAALTETVFNWPGLGRLTVAAVFTRDYPMIRGAIVLIAATFLVANLLVDLLYAALNPRIRYS